MNFAKADPSQPLKLLPPPHLWLALASIPFLVGSAGAYVVDLKLAALILALPAASVFAAFLINRVAACLALVLFFQLNDAFLALLGLPMLNKALAVFAFVAVAANCTMIQVRRTLAVGAPVFVCLAGFLALFSISIFHSEDSDLAIRSSVRLLSMVLLLLIFAFGVKNSRDLTVVIGTLVAAMATSSTVTLIDYARGKPLFGLTLEGEYSAATWDGIVRSTGTTLESVPMSATMLLGGVVLTMLLAVRNLRHRTHFFLLALLGAAAIIVTFTRSATLTLGLFLIVLLWKLRHDPSFPRVVVLAGILSLSVVVAAPSALWSKFAAVGETSSDSTVARRVSYQVIGIDLVSKNPILGVGAGNYINHYALDEYRFVPGRSEEPRPLHNIYLQFAAEVGLGGATLFSVMLVIVGRMLARASSAADPALRIYSEATFLAFSAMCIQLLFLSSSAVLHLWITIGLAVAIARITIFGFRRG